MTQRAERVTSRLLEALKAHFQYPNLHYFRPSQRGGALPVQLGLLLELRRVGSRGYPAEPVTVLEQHPSFLALQDAVQEYLQAVEAVFIPERFKQGSTAESEIERVEHAHQRLLGYMLYHQDRSSTA